MKALNDFIRGLFTWGTPACGAICAVIGVITGLMIVTLGFWSTVLVAVLALAGLFVGGVKDKQEAVKKAINIIFPANNH